MGSWEDARASPLLSAIDEVDSLKILTLINCISDGKLEGIALKGPDDFLLVFQKHLLRNMKGYKAFVRLPNCFEQLRAIEELILYGC